MKTINVPAALLKQVINGYSVTYKSDVDLVRALQELVNPYNEAITKKRNELASSGWPDFSKFGIKSEGYEQPLHKGLVNRNSFLRVLMIQAEDKPVMLYRIYNKDVVFFTMDSGYGDIHHKDGSVGATYLAGFTRDFAEVASTNLFEMQNMADSLIMEGKRVITSGLELAEYLVDNDVPLSVTEYKQGVIARNKARIEESVQKCSETLAAEQSENLYDWDSLRGMFKDMHHVVHKVYSVPKPNEEQPRTTDPRYSTGIEPIRTWPFKGFVPGVDPKMSLVDFIDANIKARSKAKKEMLAAKQEQTLIGLIPTVLKEILTEIQNSQPDNVKGINILDFVALFDSQVKSNKARQLASENAQAIVKHAEAVQNKELYKNFPEHLAKMLAEKIEEDLCSICASLGSTSLEQPVPTQQDPAEKPHSFFAHFVTVVK